LASTGATEHAQERHNLLCPRQDYTRSNLSETITLVESSRLAGLTAGTSRVDAPLCVLFYENETGRSILEYDRPSSLFGQFDDERVTAVARELDTSLERVLISAAS
jgi:hypothetical protein